MTGGNLLVTAARGTGGDVFSSGCSKVDRLLKQWHLGYGSGSALPAYGKGYATKNISAPNAMPAAILFTKNAINYHCGTSDRVRLYRWLGSPTAEQPGKALESSLMACASVVDAVMGVVSP